MATNTPNHDTQTTPKTFTFNQLIHSHKQQCRTTRRKHNRRAREAARETAWDEDEEVAELRLLGERWGEKEERFESAWNPDEEFGFSLLPESWLANRLAHKQWEREDVAKRAANSDPSFPAITRAYKSGVNKCFRAVRNYFVRHKVPAAVHDKAKAIIAEIDAPEGEVGDELEEHKVVVNGKELARKKPRHGKPLWWVKYAVVTRSEHPMLTDTAAMRRTVHRFALDLMKADDVTRIDAAKVIYHVVEAVYMPSFGEVEVAQIKESKPVRQRLWDASAPYWAYWWGVKRRSSSAD
ncbi:hypothetical protein [Erysiphe necator associated tombus-like virus 5]|nr:hypothetical protein [Erysiphe necator associated tombus-like virus 5]